MPLGTRNWGGTEYHDSIFDPESQPQEYEQPYVHSCARGGGYRRVKSTLFVKIRDPPGRKKRDPTLKKARRPPTNIWPNFHLCPGQNLHEKHFLKVFLASNTTFAPSFSYNQLDISTP